MTKKEWLEFLRLIGVVSSVEDSIDWKLRLHYCDEEEDILVRTTDWGINVLKKFLSEHGVFPVAFKI